MNIYQFTATLRPHLAQIGPGLIHVVPGAVCGVFLLVAPDADEAKKVMIDYWNNDGESDQWRPTALNELLGAEYNPPEPLKTLSKPRVISGFIDIRRHRNIIPSHN